VDATGARPSARTARRFDRIVVLDGATLDPGDNPFDGVAALGTIQRYERTTPSELLERAAGAEVLVTNKVVLDAAALRQLAGLELVCVTATGVNVVDVAAANALGITVCNVPAYGSDSVAQHVFALLLEATNRVGEHAGAVRDQRWAASPDFCFTLGARAADAGTPGGSGALTELAGLRLGLVGFGAIASRVARIAAAFGMEVAACRRRGPAVDADPVIRWGTIESIFAESDVVSLHCPLTADNRRFVEARLLASMKTGSILINTARGDLVDEAALVRALDEGKPSMALLDVLATEPPPHGHPLTTHPRCIVTPHVAWATLAARRRLMQVTAANLRAYAEGTPQNVVRTA
jgi:glycerate dehydrogenase